jgi:putative spermidine/putrescine transport system ATP-binding protein
VTRSHDGVEIFNHSVKIRGGVDKVPFGDIDALLRPEDLTVSVAPHGLGVIQHRSFLGATTRLGIGISGFNVKVDVPSTQASNFELGTRVELSVCASDVLVTERQPIS